MSQIVGIECGEETVLSYVVDSIRLHSIVHDGVVTETVNQVRSQFIDHPRHSDADVTILDYRYLSIHVKGIYDRHTGIVKIEGTGFGRVNLSVDYTQP